MATTTRIQVFEHQKLHVRSSKDELGLTEAQLDSLVRYADKSPFPYFRPIHRGVKFTQFVGVIRIGNLTIEILPKIGQYNADPELWQRVLLDMLRESKLLDIRSISEADLCVRSQSILDLYLKLYLDQAEKLFHQGLSKSYRQTDENRTSLRGKLLFPQQLTNSFIHQELFYVRHQIYDTQTIYNKLIFKALKLVLRLTTQPQLITKARTLLLNFPKQSEVQVTEATFTKLVYNRKTERYRPILTIARMLLLNYHPDVSRGNNHILAILFDMNKVWEGFILNRLRKSINKEQYAIFDQPKISFWGTKKIFPDILLKSKNKQTAGKWGNFILDTKWKANVKFSPEDDDLKQMFVYNHHFQSVRSLLIYPSLESTSKTISRPFHLLGPAGVHSCQLCALKVVDENGIDKDLVKNLLAFIYKT